jgi:hypothetical protein
VAVAIDGKPFTVFYVGGANLNRPYLHPLRKTQNGSLTIERGQHVRVRYRVVIHPGLSPAKLAELYKLIRPEPGASSIGRSMKTFLVSIAA